MTADPHTASVLEKLRRREHWLLALGEVRTELLSGGPTDRAMTLVAGHCAALSEADAVLILLADSEGGAVVAAASGELADPLRGIAVNQGDPWVAWVAGSPDATDAAGAPAPQQPDLAAVWAQTGPLLLAPIAPAEAAGGVMVCLRRAGRQPFEPDMRPEIVGLAEQGALALEMAARAAQRRSSVLMADRERIARDLHDHVIQRLFAIGLSLQGQVGRVTDDAVRARLDNAVEEIDAAIAELRSSIFDLRTADDPDRKTLRRRLADIAAAVRGASGASGGTGDSGPRVSVRVNGPVDTVVGVRLADDAEAVVREAVSNAVRHAGARTITATVTAGASLDIVVIDDGRGMPDGAARSGLKNLEQRAQAHGGTFNVGRGTGPGTRLDWSAPIT